ncbi:MAG: methyltransferase domain-containing protein [Luteitalea sp.]|nr:methyltransferase domain-containing protein [Luteitalea sp.]
MRAAAGMLIVAFGVMSTAVRAQDHGQAGGAHAKGAQHPDHMEHSFADVERYSKVFDDPARDAWQMPDRVIAALGLRPGEVVADIGAGTGYFTVRLAKSAVAPKVYAIDVEKSMVEHIRQRATREALRNVVAVQSTSDRSNLPEPVDVVLIVDTFHHIPGRAAYFTALKKLMKPGARLAIVDFKKGSPEGPPEEFRFTAAQISAELAEAGFTLQTQHDFLPRQLFLIYSAS